MKRNFIFGLLFAAIYPRLAVAGKVSTMHKASRLIRNFIFKLKKPVAEITTSALTNVVSKKVLDVLENSDESSPLPAIATYYFFINDHRVNDAQLCWVSPPSNHESNVKNIEKVFISDLRELYRSGGVSSALIEISGNRYGQPMGVIAELSICYLLEIIG